MYRREVFGSVGGFDTALGACEDYDLYLRITMDYPIQFHERMVAEYRQHGTNSTGKPALMLAMSMTVLRRQRQHIRRSEYYKEAYKNGTEFWRRLYGEPLVEEIRDNALRGEWRQALRGVIVLVRYYPQGLALLLLLLLNERRAQRHKLALRLRLRQQELQARQQQVRLYRQRLRTLKGQPGSLGSRERQIEELESALTEERQEIRWLRKRTRRLAQQIQELTLRVPDERVSSTWESLKRYLPEQLRCVLTRGPWG
jgi:hypothetical protein